MNHELKIVTTADGSKTIWNEQMGEHYHSRNGALQESRHVFLNAGLQHYLARKEIKEVSVLEVGCGTGLNFLLTAGYCSQENINLNYTGIEAYPIVPEMLSQTGYDSYVPQGIWISFITHYDLCLKQKVVIGANVTLEIAAITLLQFDSNQLYDVIYFDAFASARQPEMWNEEAIGHTIKFLKPGGVFVTYAITGNLKRMLKGFGLKIEKVPGAAGKREMLRAIK